MDDMEEPENDALPVRVIALDPAQSALVEWVDEGTYHRAYIPAGAVQDGQVGRTILQRGIPYGAPWENYLEITATPESIANELRRRGMWTWPDVATATIVESSLAIDIGEFLRRAERGEVQK